MLVGGPGAGEPEGRRWAGTGFHHPVEAAALETGRSLPAASWRLPLGTRAPFPVVTVDARAAPSCCTGRHSCLCRLSG